MNLTATTSERGVGRGLFAIFVAAVVWTVLATVMNLAVRYTWPDYAAVERSMEFTLPMLLLRLGFGVIASFAAGWAGARIAPTARVPMYIFAAVLVGLFLPVHIALWARFPAWYHLFFLLSLVAFTWLGARTAQNMISRPS